MTTGRREVSGARLLPFPHCGCTCKLSTLCVQSWAHREGTNSSRWAPVALCGSLNPPAFSFCISDFTRLKMPPNLTQA